MNENKRINKRKKIIVGGFIVLSIAVITLIIFKAIYFKRERFVKDVLSIYTSANEKYKNDNSIKFSSTGINSIDVKNKSLKYCINYDKNGVKTLEITNGMFFMEVSSKKDIKTRNVKKVNNNAFKCSNPLPVLALSGYDGEKNVRNHIFNGIISEDKIEKITFVDTNKVPDKVIGSYDASLNKDNSVMAWYLDADKNKKYELYIGGEGGVATSEDASYLFAGLYNTTLIDSRLLDTSNAKTMKGMFYYLIELKNLNVSNYDTSNVEDMSLMFYYLIRLNKLDLNNFDTRNVKSMEKMFAGEWEMTNLNLKSFNTSKVENMSSMFMDSFKLSTLNIKNFDFSKANDLHDMFKNCYALYKIKVDNLDIKKNSDFKGMFCKTDYKKDNKLFNNYSDSQRELMFNCGDIF